MVKEVQYTSVGRVLNNILDHPLMRDVTLEQAVRWAVRFMELFGFPQLYKDKLTEVEIKEHRGLLPCDLVSIVQVKDDKTGICLRAMTDSFYADTDRRGCEELSFKTSGRVIYTSFKEGKVQIAYKAVPVDDEGFPMVIDNEIYLAALEAYIKKQVFTVKFDTGKIPSNVLKNAQVEYGDLASQLRSAFTTPSVSEMESISRMLTTLIPQVRHFDTGFKKLGNREYIRYH